MWRFGGYSDEIRGCRVIGCKITCGEAYPHASKGLNTCYKVVQYTLQPRDHGRLRDAPQISRSSSLGSDLVPELCLSFIKMINIPLAFMNHSRAASCTWRDLPTDLRVGCRLSMT
jgi:hypothetical protein